MKRSGTVIDARMSLAMWLRAGRGQRNMSIEDVAKITKIQSRILERLEAGKFDGLPAEVFVRGFVRSFARCVGLGEAEALERFNLISLSTTKDPAPPSPMARGLVESMSDLAPRAASRVTGPVMLVQPPVDLVIPAMTMIPASSMDEVKIEDVVAAAAEPVVEIAIEVVEPAIEAPAIVEAASESAPAKGGQKKSKKAKAGGRKRKVATGTPFEPTPVVAAPIDDVAIAVEPLAAVAPPAEDPVVLASVEPSIVAAGETSIDVVLDEPVAVVDAEPAASDFWAPKMPPIATSVPWRRPAGIGMMSTAARVPSLVIDDSDPEGAERVLEDRAASKISTTNAQRRSFLPPILLDREDRSARQGGLTLAVILLLIAATITLSYLMRRPSSSGDGITQRDVPTLSIG